MTHSAVQVSKHCEEFFFVEFALETVILKVAVVYNGHRARLHVSDVKRCEDAVRRTGFDPNGVADWILETGVLSLIGKTLWQG
ncbi:hypothetical protein NHX12_013173 [Muraenolepis orangiensis]|uniref:Uncharacterized protein n=1 Tax=Muraenolepis orangiensis TaxID=630683 RepID=A0A9Q0I657_9TELE|nr:hypothetical protein NHX12_013173 [Muraenolepis orangiensis]